MRWDDEPYVRLYKRETPEWSVLSWQARALFHELLKRVDMAGLLMVGRSGVRGLAGLVRMPLDVVEGAMHGADGLLADGCVVEVDGGYLLPNFVEAQQARQSDRARKAEQRARDRATKLATGKGHAMPEPVTTADNLGQSVTNRDHESQNVTESHTRSHDVTRGHSEQSRAEQSRTEITPSECGAREAPAAPARSPKPKSDRAKPATGVPAATDLHAWLASWSIPAPEVNREAAKFIDYARANGRTYRDWSAAWRNWERNAAEFAARDGRGIVADPAPLPKLPPGTGELPPVLTAQPRPTAPREPPDNPVLRALGASPRPQSGAAPTSIGDLLANLAPPQSFEGSK